MVIMHVSNKVSKKGKNKWHVLECKNLFTKSMIFDTGVSRKCCKVKKTLSEASKHLDHLQRLLRTSDKWPMIHPQSVFLVTPQKSPKPRNLTLLIILTRLEGLVLESVGGAHALGKCQWVSANTLKSLRGLSDMLEKIIENMCRGVFVRIPPPLDMKHA